MTINASTLSDNNVYHGDGGGIFNYGGASITDCTLSGNEARVSSVSWDYWVVGVQGRRHLQLLRCVLDDQTEYRDQEHHGGVQRGGHLHAQLLFHKGE
jgi:hypothetical protein